MALPQTTIKREREVAEIQETSEKLPIEEIGREPEVTPEVSEWIQRVQQLGEDVTLPAPLSQIPQSPQISTTQQAIVVTLPLTVEEIKQAAKRHEFVEALVWMSQWCIRVLKIAHERGLKVVFKKKNES